MKSTLALKYRSRAVAAAAAPVTFSVPLADLTEFLTLPKAMRTEVQFTLCVLEQLRRAIPKRCCTKVSLGRARAAASQLNAPFCAPFGAASAEDAAGPVAAVVQAAACRPRNRRNGKNVAKSLENWPA